MLDGLAAEREQGITIDVAYRFFATERRKFIVADTPGHEQYSKTQPSQRYCSAKLRVDHQAVKDELARLKHLPPRPPIKPSGMDKSTQAKGPEAGDEKGGRSSRRRGNQLDRLKIGAIIVVRPTRLRARATRDLRTSLFRT